jgi:hypothetical protein
MYALPEIPAVLTESLDEDAIETEGHTLEEVARMRNFKIPKGLARRSLALMAHRIQNEPANGLIRKPLKTINRINYAFLEMMMSGELPPKQFLLGFAILHDRLDGKAAQSLTIDDKRDLNEISDDQLNAAIIAIRAILSAQGSGTGVSAPSEPEPTGEL